MENPVDQVPPTPTAKEQVAEVAKPTWTSDALLAIAEETSNHGAHTPAYGEVEKRWKDVLEAMKNRGYHFSNFWALQRHFDRLLEEYKKSASERAKVSGVEDVEEDPLQMLLEDISDEIQDHQAEKAQKNGREE
jgi:hypothetical protein